MIQRGRKSAAALSVVKSEGRHIPDPPASLEPEAAEVWKSVMSSPVSDLISEGALPILEQYCTAIQNSRKIKDMLDSLGPGCDVKDYERLLKLQIKLQNTIATLGMRLRLTPSSVDTRSGKATQLLRRVPEKKPWETD